MREQDRGYSRKGTRKSPEVPWKGDTTIQAIPGQGIVGTEDSGHSAQHLPLRLMPPRLIPLCLVLPVGTE